MEIGQIQLENLMSESSDVLCKWFFYVVGQYLRHSGVHWATNKIFVWTTLTRIFHFSESLNQVSMPLLLLCVCVYKPPGKLLTKHCSHNCGFHTEIYNPNGFYNLC